ncbi:type II secretion system major pseudopilin GspG [Ideonella sp. DXS22W]|uniref:Type II secretion system core protein G n=1 Tax=Pseudaquabacterium inlustre TaxID=2984192 RepID=A0ABU9CKZ4_9BURK
MNSPSTSTCRHRGFTLLELLIVLAILGLLAVFVAPRYFDQLGRSRGQVAQAQLRALADALEHYRVDTGRYPSSEQGLAALQAAPAGEPRWRGPYLKGVVPADPWGQAYRYEGPAAGREFRLLCLGRDGRPGGQGEDQDIGVDG